MKIDLRKERNYIIAATILSFLGGIPRIGGVFFIPAVILTYLAFDGYEKKLGLSEPKRLYLKSLLLSIVSVLIAVYIKIQLSEKMVPGKFPAFSPEVILSLVILWAIYILTVWFTTNAFEKLGEHFRIEEFSKYKKTALALVVGFPLWIALAVVIIGLFIILGLAIASILYFIIGISKLPKTLDTEPGGNTTPVY